MAWKRSSKRMTDETDDGRKVAQNRLLVWLSRRCINAQSSEQNVGSAWWRSLLGCRAEAGSSCTRKCRFVLFQPSGYLYPSLTLSLYACLCPFSMEEFLCSDHPIRESWFHTLMHRNPLLYQIMTDWMTLTNHSSSILVFIPSYQRNVID